MAAIANILKEVRSLSQDKFPTPLLYIRKVSKPLWTISVSSTGIFIVDTEPAVDSAIEEFLFADYPTLDDLLGALLVSDNAYSLAASHAYRPTAASTSLLVQPAKSLGEIVSLTQRYLLDDATIKETFMYDYFYRYYSSVVPEDFTSSVFDEAVLALVAPRDRHFTLFTAYYYVEHRRFLEFSARTLEVVFTNDELAFKGVYTGNGLSDGNIEVAVADVFRVSEGPREMSSARLDLVGADNVFGDENSFWYRLQVHIREQFERLFGDYGLRNSQAMQSVLTVEKLHDYYGHFRSYPFTNGLSPFARAFPQNGR